MILFPSDYYKEKVYFDTKSTNISALHMTRVLHNMGIKNNKFFMVTTQKDLIGRDIHKADPSEELAGIIAYEVKVNPWYYYREVVRVPIQGGAPIPFKFHRGNLALAHMFYCNIDMYLVMPRQTGKSVTTQTIVGHTMYFSGMNFTQTLITKDTDLVQSNVTRLRAIRDAYPKYLIHKSKDDTDNKEGLSYAILNNSYATHTKANDQFSANNLGRGLTTAFIHWDELEFLRYNYITYPAAVAATTEAKAQAKANGLPYSMIITSTAGNLDTEECKFALKLINKAMPFTEKLYDCEDREALEALVSRNSPSKMVYAVFSYLQLGYTHEWFKETSVRTSGSQEDVARDYLNIRQAGTSSSALDREILEAIKSSEKEPVHISLDGGYMFRWYVHPDQVFANPNKVLIAGLDTSENIGKDFTTAVFVDPEDMSVVATTRCNESDLVLFTRFLGRFMVEHPGVILIPERKSTATMMISLLCELFRASGIDPYTRIFNMIFQNKQEPQFRDIVTSNTKLELGPEKKYLGFSTAGQGETSRNSIYKLTLNKTLERNANRIHDSILINEFCALSVKNGRIDHKNSGHDDMVFAYLLACWFIFFAKNIKLYNVDPTLFLSRVNTKGHKIDPSDKNLYLQTTLRIKELRDMIQKIPIGPVRESYIRELRTLEDMIAPINMAIDPIRGDDVSSGMNQENPDYLVQAFLRMRT